MNQQIVIEAIAQQLSFTGQLTNNVPSNVAPVSIRGEAYLEKMCNSIERLHPFSKCNDLLGLWVNNTNIY